MPRVLLEEDLVRSAIVVLVLACAGCASPPGAPAVAGVAAVRSDVPSAADLAIAFDVLARAEELTTAGVGDTGAVPWENRALALLVSARDGAALRRLLDEATPAGQLFALCGLARLDAAAYRAVLPRFAARTDEVSYCFFCEGGELPVGDVVRELETSKLLEWVLDERAFLPVHGLERRDARLRALRDDPDPWARRDAIRSLGELGPWARPAARPLADALRGDPDLHVRTAAARGLARLGEDARPAAPVLRAASTSPELPLDARVWAFRALRTLAPDDPALRGAGLALAAAALEDPDPALRRWGRREAGDAELGPETAILFDARRNGERDENVWTRALEELAQCDPRAPRTIAAVRSWALHDDGGTRVDAAELLAEGGDAGRSALADAVEEVRRAGRLDATIQLAALLHPAVPPDELLEALRPDAPRATRLAALRAGAILETPGVLRALVAVLGDADPALRREAREALGRLADLAGEELTEVSNPADPIAEADARLGLGLDADGAARATLVAALAGDDEERRARAAQALAVHAPEALEGVELRDPWSRLELAVTSSSMDDAARERLDDTLDRLLRDEDAQVRRVAALSLSTERAVVHLEHPDPAVRFHVALDLGPDDASPDEVARALLEPPADADATTRGDALWRLLELAADVSPEVRERIVERALRALEDPPVELEAVVDGVFRLHAHARALRETRSAQAVGLLCADLSTWWEEDGRAEADAALTARLAVERDPRLRYLLESCLAELRRPRAE